MERASIASGESSAPGVRSALTASVHDRSRFAPLALGCTVLQLAAVCVYLAWRIAAKVDGTAVTMVTDLVFPLVGLLAVLPAVAAGLTAVDVRTRRSWLVMSLALSAYWVGDVLWAIIELGLGGPQDVSIADAFYLLVYPLAAAALLLLPTAPRSSFDRVALTVDALLVLIAGAMVEWVFVIGPQIGTTGLTPEGLVAGAAYPIGDLLLVLGLGTAILRRRNSRFGAPLLFLIAALVANFMGDLISGSAWLSKDFASGGLFDIAFMGFWVLAGAAATAQLFAGPEVPDSGLAHPPRAVNLLPYCAIVIGYVLLLATELGAATSNRVVMVLGAMTLTALTIARQVAMARQNIGLAAEHAALVAETRFDALLREASDTIAVVDRSGVVLFYSGRAATGESGSDRKPVVVVGCSIATLAHEEDRPHLLSFVGRVADGTARSAVHAWREVDADGSGVQVESTAVNRLADPDLRGIVLTTRDITERVRLETELGQARRLDAIGRLAGGVAHEFNNILTVVRGYAEILVDDLDGDDPRREDAQAIKGAADRAARLTSQLLAFGQREPVELEPVELVGTLAEMAPRLRRMLGADVSLEIMVEAGVPPVLTASFLLQRIITEIAASARDAMPGRGHLEIAVRGERPGEPCIGRDALDGASAHVLVIIRDPDAAIQDAARARVFEPFPSTEGLSLGSGLGLAEAYGMARQAGGWIEVAGGAKGGSEFRIHLAPASAASGPSVASGRLADLTVGGVRAPLP